MKRAPGLGFFLFILLNASLFIRPVDLIESLAGWPIYNVLIVSSLAVSAGAVLFQLTRGSLSRNPIHACTLCFWACMVLSLLSQFLIGEAINIGIELGKTVLFYFLVVALLESYPRIRKFLLWLCFFVVVLTAVAMLQYYEVINIPALEPVKQGQEEVDEETGKPIILARLQSVGFYNNPNDLSRILVIGILISLYFLGDRRLAMMRPLWLLPLGVFGQALHLTHSRGGLLSLFGGLGSLFYFRYGTKKTLLLGALILPALIIASAGRQTDFSTSGGTAQARIMIWTEGFAEMRSAPLLGIGVDHYVERVHIVAHNSFVQCYVEVGFIGGTFFFGIFYLLIEGLRPRAPNQLLGLDPELARLCPFMFAFVIATVVGMFSSTRSYTVTTYLIVGLCAAYLRVLGDRGYALLPRFDGRLLRRLFVASALFLFGLHTYTRLSARY